MARDSEHLGRLLRVLWLLACLGEVKPTRKLLANSPFLGLATEDVQSQERRTNGGGHWQQDK